MNRVLGIIICIIIFIIGNGILYKYKDRSEERRVGKECM